MNFQTLLTAWRTHSRRVIRLLLLLGYLLVGVLVAGIFLSPRQHRSPRHWPTRLWFRGLCWIFNLSLTHHGQPLKTPTLFVANHISWVDIVVLSCCTEGYFLAKGSVRTWPLIGGLATRAGVSYIERGEQGAAQRAIQTLTVRLQRGDSMIVFPEATSTTGQDVNRFFPPLFDAAIQAQVPVQPIALRYLTPHQTRDEIVPFVGEDTLGAHIWRLLGQPRLHAEVSFLPPYSPPLGSRRELATQCHAEIKAHLHADAVSVHTSGDRPPEFSE